ncbi:hypothetical protein GV054_21145 [Marinomonas mediterranea]|uniref:hypothetical protein n=1 Tax=Marinomonas mediterranea TaxID=119864 RepID=UPI00234BD387|nr:hypothetical protein [Marinomonas mediterranea]WCN15334.1 hypothetical protein GV054_21145 [Marinomonas mediterranea]
MRPELSIKLEYLQNRNNPAEVFEAMALYINAYRDLGQLLTNSVGLKTDFNFQLNDIEKGSILSKLSAMSTKIDSMLENAFYSSGNSLFQELTTVSEISSENQVEGLAAGLETTLSDKLDREIADPYIDRQNLAHVLNSFSSANQKVQPGENVFLISGNNSKQLCSINTAWRFTGKPKEMFQGKTVSHEHRDKLYVKVSVNEGNSVWSFRSISIDKRFNARIVHKDWLQRYQSGLVPAIGPKDIIEADISYDVYTPPKGKGQPQIRNARIKFVVDVKRNNGHQYEL